MRFDAECDVASIVFGPGDDPDRLLTEFAGDVSAAGFRVVGAIQIGHDCHAENPQLSVLTLPEGRRESLVQAHMPRGPGCRLDDAGFAKLAARLSDAVEPNADLIVISRFGHSEADGAGLAALIARATDADIPLLIAVSERRFPSWIRFCQGMSVRLGCRRKELDRWWDVVARGAYDLRERAPRNLCEFVK
ncbi:DUF2478 domain-containing protein [Microbacteriaceae bacterium K1510]|nr:DUF2478 domain-containing protein [Microbacteriaceae bacterium K1510]